MKFYIWFRKFVLIPDLRTWCEYYINKVFVVNFSSGLSLRESQQLKAPISSIRVNLVPKRPQACLYVSCWIWSGRHRRCPRQAFSTFLFLLVRDRGGKFNQDCSNQQIFETPKQLCPFDSVIIFICLCLVFILFCFYYSKSGLQSICYP